MRATYPNLLSRVFLKRPFERQFIVPPPPPRLLEAYLVWFERHLLRVDTRSLRIDRPIFLVGLHRSGTTLLQDLLCLHPQVAYVTNAMASFRRCFCAAELFRKTLGLDVRGERMLGDGVEVSAGSPNEGVVFWRDWLREDHWSLDHAPLRLADLAAGEQERIRETIRRVLWCHGGAPRRFFCKNPGLLPHLELLAGLFPDARFVHIVRDARACAPSMVRLYRREQEQLRRIRDTGGHGVLDGRPYVAFPRLPRLAEYVAAHGADSIETTARLWSDALDEVRRVRDRLPALHEVRYEDILARPAEAVGRVVEFCELPAFAAGQGSYWQKIREVREVHHPEGDADRQVIEALCRDNLIRYGYLP